MDEELPKITLRQLATAERTCPRRLALDLDGQRANRPADRQYRVSNQLDADARLAHARLGPPEPRHFRPTDDLHVEEQRVYEIAAAWYVALFGDEPRRTADEETDRFETVARRTGVRLVGPAGLALEAADGARELRLLSLGAPFVEELLDAPGTRFALLRRARWTRLGDLRVVRADLLDGWSVAETINGTEAWDELVDWFGARLAVIRSRADRSAPRTGWECARCRYIAGCAAVR